MHTLATIKCDSCDEMFTTTLSKEVHMKRLHEYLRYPCPHCPKGFSWKYYLTRHVACHQRIKEKPKVKTSVKLDRGSIRSSPRDGVSTPSAFGSSCTEFVCPECWHFDNDATSKIDDVLTEYVGLLHVLPCLTVHLRFFLLDQ